MYDNDSRAKVKRQAFKSLAIARLYFFIYCWQAFMNMDKALQELVERHMASFSDWKEGKPVKLFIRDGLPCVKYESGLWWHYNITKGTWF